MIAATGTSVRSPRAAFRPRRSLARGERCAGAVARVEHRQRADDVRCEWGVTGELLARVRRRRHRGCCRSARRSTSPWVAAQGPAASAGPMRLRPRSCWRATASWRGGAGGRWTAVQAGGGTEAPSLRPSSLLGLAWQHLLGRCRRPTARRCAPPPPGTHAALDRLRRNATAVAEAAARAAADRSGWSRRASAGPTTRCGRGRGRARRGAIVGRSGAWAAGSDASPEAELVAAQFAAARPRLPAVLAGLASGRELIADGYGADVDLAAAHDVSAAAPRLVDGILVGRRSARRRGGTRRNTGRIASGP